MRLFFFRKSDRERESPLGDRANYRDSVLGDSPFSFGVFYSFDAHLARLFQVQWHRGTGLIWYLHSFILFGLGRGEGRRRESGKEARRRRRRREIGGGPLKLDMQSTRHDSPSNPERTKKRGEMLSVQISTLVVSFFLSLFFGNQVLQDKWCAMQKKRGENWGMDDPEHDRFVNTMQRHDFSSS